MITKIAIHSVPRSGSTWLGKIFDSSPYVLYKYQPLFSYAFKDRLSQKSTSSEIEEFFNSLLNVTDPFLDQKEEKIKGIIPVFQKEEIRAVVYKEVRYHHILSNLLLKDREVKVVGLIRNPFAVINSWYKAPKEFRADLGWRIENEWKYAPSKNQNKPEEFNGYEKWKVTAFLFLELAKEFPQQFRLVQYENLLKAPVNEVKKLFEFSGLDIHPQTKKFIEKSISLNQKDAYSVFKKKENDETWKTELPDFIFSEIKNDPDFWRLNDNFHWMQNPGLKNGFPKF